MKFEVFALASLLILSLPFQAQAEEPAQAPAPRKNEYELSASPLINVGSGHSGVNVGNKFGFSFYGGKALKRPGLEDADFAISGGPIQGRNPIGLASFRLMYNPDRDNTSGRPSPYAGVIIDSTQQNTSVGTLIAIKLPLLKNGSFVPGFYIPVLGSMVIDMNNNTGTAGVLAGRLGIEKQFGDIVKLRAHIESHLTKNFFNPNDLPEKDYKVPVGWGNYTKAAAEARVTTTENVDLTANLVADSNRYAIKKIDENSKVIEQTVQSSGLTASIGVAGRF